MQAGIASTAVALPLAEIVELLSTPPLHTPDRSRIAFSQPAGLPGVEIMKAEDCQRLWRVFHSDYAICTIGKSGGVSEWRYRHRSYASAANSLILVEPGEVHSNTRITSPGSFQVLSLAPELMAEFARSAGLGPRPHIETSATARPDLVRAFAAFHTAEEAGASLLERQSLLTRGIGLMLAHCCEASPKDRAPPAPPALKRARDYLQHYWTENVSLDRLAGLAGLSRFHFLCAFEREFSLPPHAYQISVRVEKVRLLLRTGVPAAGIDAGFSDQSHLIRHFKRAWGVTPAQYAAMVGAGRRRSDEPLCEPLRDTPGGI